MDNGGMTERDDAFFRDQNQKEARRVEKLLAYAVCWLYIRHIREIPPEIREGINLASRIEQ